jgi:Flp pilus assembly protein TadG
MFKTFKRGEKGQTTAEFVVILPMMLLLFFLVVDFGWLLKNWIVVTNTAREAARCVVTESCSIDGDDVTAEELIDERLYQGLTSNLTGIDKEILYVDQNGDGDITDGDSVVVCIRADNEYIGPVLALLSLATGGSLPDPLPLGAREEMRLEFPPSGSPSVSESSSCTFGG